MQSLNHSGYLYLSGSYTSKPSSSTTQNNLASSHETQPRHRTYPPPTLLSHSRRYLRILENTSALHIARDASGRLVLQLPNNHLESRYWMENCCLLRYLSGGSKLMDV